MFKTTRIVFCCFFIGFVSILIVSSRATTDTNFISTSGISAFQPSLSPLKRVNRAFDTSNEFWAQTCVSDVWANSARKCPRGNPCGYRKCSSQKGWEYKCCTSQNLIYIKGRHRTLKYAGDRHKTPVWWIFNRLYFIKDAATDIQRHKDYDETFVPLVKSEEPIQEIDNFL